MSSEKDQIESSVASDGSPVIGSGGVMGTTACLSRLGLAARLLFCVAEAVAVDLDSVTCVLVGGTGLGDQSRLVIKGVASPVVIPRSVAVQLVQALAADSSTTQAR